MNDDEVWELAREPITEFVGSIKEMNTNVDKLIKFYKQHTSNNSQQPDSSNNDEPQQTLSPLAVAKLELAIVFAINACYWMYLITHGENPSKNEISKDIERVRLFMRRAQEVEDQLLPQKSSSNKRPKIDKEASKRLCRNNMSLKSEWA